ncbi:hypothetical protein [Azospirillum sp. sgz302134]
MPDFPFLTTITAPDAATAKALRDQIAAFVATTLLKPAGASVSVCAVSQDPARDALIRETAQEMACVCEGELEINDCSIVSEGSDNGAYVQSWLWVPFRGTDLDKDVIAAVDAALEHARAHDYRPGPDDDDMIDTMLVAACEAHGLDLSERQCQRAVAQLRDRVDELDEQPAALREAA